jgi:hypothetical protein
MLGIHVSEETPLFLRNFIWLQLPPLLPRSAYVSRLYSTYYAVQGEGIKECRCATGVCVGGGT